MQSLRMMHTMHGLHGLLDESGRRPTPRFEIGKDMYVVDMYRSSCSQLTMRFAPRTARLIGCQRFACILRHRVNVGVEGKRFFQYQGSIRIMRTEYYRGNIRTTTCLQSVLDTWNNRFLHPGDIVVDGGHCLAETD